MGAPPWDALSGQYQLQPGVPCSIVGQRPILGAGRLGRLLRGQQGPQVTRTLTQVFTLCAHAHQRTAELALAAAQAHSAAAGANASSGPLYVETARDHLRSIALDWPQRLPDLTPATPDLAWLRDCPLPLSASRPCTDSTQAWALLGQLRAWLEQRVLGQALADWLDAHRDPDALAVWCHAKAAHLSPLRSLCAWHPIAHTLAPETRCLEVLDTDSERQSAQLHQLAQALSDEPDFVQRPTWLGRCAETGPWARLRHRRPAAPAHNAWTRVSARWLELMEIAAASPRPPGPGDPPLLASGALRLGDGQALAWCEMARGLLLHWVQLDATGAVHDYRVLAPTEWNFHPQGALAKALSALPPENTAAARVLAAAYDPCVACTV
ncbi:MAG: hypothetical protein A3F78_12395 [Burkholderiales bacterium RIFCSPLOWO2_12_FULL_61_40]|nr:MAG: hypothetical protein A3F78_12395 [Burkholderiales bacterium RIFCSPLOWO2_12_FULL_61_40]